MKVIIFGDSHVNALCENIHVLDGHDTELVINHGLNWVSPHFEDEAGGIRVRADAVENVEPLDMLLQPGGRHYFSSILHTAPYTRAADWRRFRPWSVMGDFPRLQPVSDAVLQTWVAREIAVRLAFLSELRAKGFDIRVIEAPRPLERAPALHVIDPDVMARVDTICRDFIKMRLARAGIRVIGVPRETLSGAFTAEAYSAERLADPHHANLEYGRLTMLRILDDLTTA